MKYFSCYHIINGSAMLFIQILVLFSTAVVANIDIRRAGWLDRVVEYQKNKFFEDLKKLPAVNLKARIEKAPAGYVDSGNWDYDSVIRLLTLIRDSDGAKSVRRVLRRSMQSSRRFMSFAQSFKAFPSLAKDHQNDFHYDVDSGEYYADMTTHRTGGDKLDDDDVIVVSNPVEARLPSARISVKLLKHILENRAKAARATTSTKKPLSWSTKKKLTNATRKTADSTNHTTSISTKSRITSNVTTQSSTTPQTDSSPTTTTPNLSTPMPTT